MATETKPDDKPKAVPKPDKAVLDQKIEDKNKLVTDKQTIKK